MQSQFSSIRALILDMDGVLWKDDQPIGDLSALFAKISQKQLKVLLATNNATKSVQQYLDKLAEFGVHLESWQVINSPLATAAYMHKYYPQGGPIYVIGETGLISSLQEQGFYLDEHSALAVVVGMDRALTYDKLRVATLLIRAGAIFIATNPDRTFPTPQGLVPGAGSILAAIEAATDTKPIVIGKPAPEMYQVALQRLGTTPAETLVVGDRLETDIAGAQQIDCYTALVLSGVTTVEQATFWSPPPNLIASDLTAVLEQL